MLTYKEKAGFGTVTIEPNDKYWYYIVKDLETRGRFVVRQHVDNPNTIDWWCPNEWHDGFKLDYLCNVENLRWILINKKYSYTLPTKDTCLAYSNN